jgi:hypothetical protein
MVVEYEITYSRGQGIIDVVTLKAEGYLFDRGPHDGIYATFLWDGTPVGTFVNPVSIKCLTEIKPKPTQDTAEQLTKVMSTHNDMPDASYGL